ncbi:hypothetical protein AVEN_109210-1 [Araneus ventricosus]|uniref:Secreted protein n=1 Tax=Araneus ventricosus TaxID=182803 RepID=A0A4Y2X5G1_ARAVE|nr:hypothetical protein AVEN_109210-1 [Araneus ventricosus]
MSRSVVRRLLSQVCLLECILSGEMPTSLGTSKASKSTDGKIRTVPMDCCRLCMSRGNCATGRIPNINKSPSMTLSKQAIDCWNKA